MLLVGIDWADTEHVFCLMDEAGTTLQSGVVPHTPKGLDRLLIAIRAHVTSPTEVCVALETSHGPLVGTLLEQGFTIFAINPKAVDRHRERFRVAGAKSDCGTLGCWPPCCAPTAPSIAPSCLTPRSPRNSACSLVIARNWSGRGPCSRTS